MNFLYGILLIGALVCIGVFWYIVADPTFTIFGLHRFVAMILVSVGALICVSPVLLSMFKKDEEDT